MSEDEFVNDNNGLDNKQSNLTNDSDNDEYNEEEEEDVNDDDANNSDFIIHPLKIIDNTSEDPICNLWYIPSQVEIIMVY